MAAHLSGGRVNIGLVREAARKELLNCLDKCPGSKVRCIDIYFDEVLAFLIDVTQAFIFQISVFDFYYSVANYARCKLLIVTCALL